MFNSFSINRLISAAFSVFLQLFLVAVLDYSNHKLYNLIFFCATDLSDSLSDNLTFVLRNR